MREVNTSIKSIQETISVCLNNDLLFAAYRLPNKTEPELIVQRDHRLQQVENLANITELNGFLVAPFVSSAENPMFIIRPDYYFKGEVSEVQIEEIIKINPTKKAGTEQELPYEVTKEEYLTQIDKIVNSIQNNEVKKVVLSRVKIVENNLADHIPELLSNLCDRFPNAFIYIFSTPGKLWVGATPEPFAFLNNDVFHTSSVAGTKENRDKYRSIENWGSKEKQEQKYVSDYINSVLNANHWENIKHHGPYVKKAGNLLHLRTDFTSNSGPTNGNLGHLISTLHPTPAVCGFPKNEALQMISEVEKHNREYYSGFLGPVGMGQPVRLFVNLRCMKIVGSHIVLYSGGGLTIDSHPVDEWYETEIKASTLLSVIQDI